MLQFKIRTHTNAADVRSEMKAVLSRILAM